ncbi:MAG: molybdenum cofactor biosynthesis protein MoaE [Terracidiphilus sp.]|jgi:molybdopterin synthase catalytic subunit
MMQVRVLPFGVLKDWLGSSAATVDLPEGATVAELLERLSAGQAAPQTAQLLRGIAVSVNDEFAGAAQVLRAGDEVGLLPPVSGGCARAAGGNGQSEDRPAAALTREPIDAERLIAAAKSREDGAVVVFDGMVRNNSRGRQTLYLDYEAHDQLAVKQMKALVEEALDRFGIRDAFIVHRLGRLQVGETSVLIVVMAAHRGPAFDACRWLIDTLKKTVPIWKKETFADGTVWAAGEPFPAGLAVAPPEASHEE